MTALYLCKFDVYQAHQELHQEIFVMADKAYFMLLPTIFHRWFYDTCLFLDSDILVDKVALTLCMLKLVLGLMKFNSPYIGSLGLGSLCLEFLGSESINLGSLSLDLEL